MKNIGLIPGLALAFTCLAASPALAQQQCRTTATPADGRAPTITASDVVHLYWGSPWTGSLGAYAQGQNTTWDDILNGGMFGSDWVNGLQQYALPASKTITTEFLGGLFEATSLDLSPNTVLTNAQINAEVEAEVAPWMPPDGRTKIFVIYLPPGVATDAMVDPGTNHLNGVVGYHYQDPNRADYQIIPMFYQPYQDGASGVSANLVESHEIIEAITNPNHQGWHYNKTTEIADVCQSSGSYAWTGLAGTYHLAKYWSNAACACATL